MDRSEISKLNEQLKTKQVLFRYYQYGQENLKRVHDYFDPYDNPGLDREQWEMKCQMEMSENKYTLRNLQKEIIELRSKIKKIQRKQND